MAERPARIPEPLPEFAPRWLQQRRLGFAKLEELQRNELCTMTEAEAARVFAQLDPPRPYPLRASSGLVEQQRWFRLLRECHERNTGRSS